jgi:hypothetical protein
MTATANNGEQVKGQGPVAGVIPLTQRAEQEQAQLFARELRHEIATMTTNVANAEQAWQRRCDSHGHIEPPERLAVVRERLTEAQRMLAALKARYPQS